MNIPLPLYWSPLVAYVCCDVDHLERSEETVFDAFLEAVCIERLSEISDVRLVSRLLRRCSHTQLDGIAEILENLAPVAVVLRAPSVALVDDNKVEELGFEEFAVVLLSALSYHLLIEREIHLVGSDSCAEVLLVVYFMYCLA